MYNVICKVINEILNNELLLPYFVCTANIFLLIYLYHTCTDDACCVIIHGPMLIEENNYAYLHQNVVFLHYIADLQMLKK